jgi:DNA (cytosine-5)-methyltransferase 1
LIPFDTTQITSRANRSAPAPGDPCHPLPASGHPPSVAFTLNGSPRGTGPNSGNGWNSTLPVQVMPALQAGSPTYERGDGSLFCVPQVAWALEARDAKGVNSNTKDGHLLSGPLRSNPRNNSNGASEAKMHVYEPRIGVRRLTCRECERLQGFPDDWTDPIDTNPKRIASTHRYRMLGNAVEVHCAKWIGDRLAQEILL